MSRLVDVALASKIGANRIMALLGVFALLLATSSAQAQSWPFKKKTNDPRPASTQKDPNSSATP